MSEKLVPIGLRSASKRGGSVSINIPSQITKLIDLKAGDPIAFFYDPQRKRIIIEKISSFLTPSGLSFSVSKGAEAELVENVKTRRRSKNVER